ncbi:hypothetical protein [Variovorax paradoxus]|uniref:hypothetical protein n=1 Tax=Variovorax paradoxus TaxID=34073 RepID=UPI0029C759E5|nr:hypothetical protein [Variovorax paradoxus]WPH23684.1 hypothetical protein RZE78_32070 [Variovorax paradoxus]
MQRITLTLLLLAASTSFAAGNTSKEISLGKLHQRYVKAGYSTIDLPEFDKRISFSGVVIGGPTKGFKRGPDSANGGALLKVGVPGSENELARMVARDVANAEKMATLMSGAAFKATCTVAFAQGVDYIPLQDCVFH